MNTKKPTYEELEKKLAKAEKHIAKIQGNKINTAGDSRNTAQGWLDTSLLSTEELSKAYIASEQNFKNSMDGSPLGVRIVTEDGELIYANKSALNTFGYQTVEELAAVKRRELYTPESYAAYLERRRKRKLNEYVPGEYEESIRRPDGEIRTLMVFRREVMWGGERQFMTMYQDITENKRAAEALRESEDKYRNLVERSNDGIIYIQEGMIQYCNPKILEMSGYTTKEVFGKLFIDFIVPEQREKVLEIYRKRIAGEKVPERYELRFISKGGNIIQTEISASLFYNQQKMVDIVILRDITERKKVEEALRQSEEMFAKAFRSSPDAVTITTFDDKSIVIDTNNAAVKNTGYSFNEMIGHSILELNLWVNLEDREKMHRLIREEGRVSKEEYQFRKKSGEIRTWEFSAEPIVIGGRNCIISVQRDITERKQAEEQLANEAIRRRILIEQSRDGIVILDQNGKAHEANRRFAEMLGYSPEEVTELNVWDWAVQASRERALDMIRNINEAGDHFETRYRRKDGTVFDVEISTNGATFAGKKFIFYVCRDITERKRAEEALKESEETFAKAFYNSPSLMAISTVKEGRIVEVNDIYCRTTGYSRKELLGHTTRELNLWYDPAQREAVVNTLKKKGIVNDSIVQMRTKSGEIQTVDLSAAKITLKNEPCLLTIAADITEHKRAEEALQKEQRLLSDVLTSIQDGISVLDNDFKIISVNKAVEKLFQHTMPLVGKKCYEAYHGRTEQCEFCPTKRALESGKAVYNVIPRTGEGGQITGWLELHHFALIDERTGDMTGTIEYVRDITERKRAEDALKESEREKAAILNGVSELVTYQDRELRVLWANRAAGESVGISLEKLVGRHCYEIWQNRKEPCVGCPVVESFETGQPHEAEMVSPDGRIWFVRGYPVRDEKGSVLGVTEITLEISKRKKSEDALKESEARFRALFETMAQGVVYQGADGKIISANPAAERILGLTLDQILGRTSVDPRWKSIREDGTGFPGEEHPSMVALRTGKPVDNMVMGVFNPVTNEYRWILICATPEFREGEKTPYRAYTTFTDITEQKKAEKALHESEERYRLIFENSKDAILLTSPDGKILAANQEACRMFGRSEDEICHIGRSGIIDTSDPRLDKAIEKRKATGEFKGELTGIRADGTKFPIDLSSRVFYDKDGRARTSMIIRDISESKRMEEQLERDREEIKLIIDSTPILVFYKDTKGKFIRVNKAFATTLNISEKDFLGKTVFDLYTKDMAQGMTDDDQEVYKSGRSKLNIIEQYMSASGLRWVQTDKIPIFDKDNKVIGLVGFAQDITERKAAEEALIESEERFNKAFHSSPNLMAVLTLEEGHFIDVNEAHTRITGYERREVIGKTTLELNLWVHPEQRKVFYSILNSEGRLNDFEVLMQPKSGEIRTLLYSAEKITIRGVNCLVVVAVDITERKEAEERINHLNLTLRAIRNVNQLITREKDRDLLIQSVCDGLVESRSFNSAWIVLLGETQQPVAWAGANVNKEFPALIELIKQYQMPQCAKKALKQKQVVLTEDPQKTCQGCPALGDSTDTGSMSIRLEIEGKIYGVLCVSIPKILIRDKDEISLFTEIAADIAFALRDTELVAANALREQERLSLAKLESIGMLAGGIAHDFNNLLTGILGNIGLVKTYIPSSDKNYEMLDEAERAALRARDLTQQLLTFARGGKPVKKLADIAKILKESAAFSLRGSNVKLELSLPDNLWKIEADEGQIGQVINNMVINAFEAMPLGGTLKINAQNLAFKKNATLPLQSGNYVLIDIIDTGIGISPEHLSRIFEPYFTTKQRGSGLGLTTAYSVVRNHGGIIMAESILNTGSTFHIYLPASKRAVKGGKKLTVEHAGQAGGKVLIMDDEEIIRKMLKNMLGMAGYTVEVSTDGAEALEKYQQAKESGDPFNAVIMDLTVPGGMGGKEAVKKLLEIDPKATVIVSSGYATDPIMSDFKKYGFKAVIAKPYSVRQLRESLSNILTKKKR